MEIQAKRLYRELTIIGWMDQSENYEEDIHWLEELIQEYGYRLAKIIAS